MTSCFIGASRDDAGEADRVAALRRYQILDTPPEEVFDRVTRIVRKMFDVPMAAISMIDETRHWLKSKQGPMQTELPRNLVFCNETLHCDGALYIPDALDDPRYADNPLVRGEPHLRFYAGVPLRTAHGHAVGTLCCLDVEPRSLEPRQLEVLSDLGQIVVDELELRLVASMDHLTGVMSRRAFCAAAERDLATTKRHASFSCIVFDVDLFKRVNDTHGHPAGDAVLKNVAHTCETVLRGLGYIGRIGGEEFAVALPGFDAVRATRVAETLREAVAEMVTGCGTANVQVTISVGIASNAAAENTKLDRLLSEADRAVYAAKRAGRNLCVRSDEVAFIARQWPCVA